MVSPLAAVIIFLAGVALGGIVFSLVVSYRSRGMQGQLEARAGSAEAIVNEVRQQCQQGQEESERLRAQLAAESNARVEAVARCAASELRLKEEMERLEAFRKELSETFKALSLDALANNTNEFKKYADDFMKLAEEKLKSQTAEGKKELEGKKDLIDRNIDSSADPDRGPETDRRCGQGERRAHHRGDHPYQEARRSHDEAQGHDGAPRPGTGEFQEAGRMG